MTGRNNEVGAHHEPGDPDKDAEIIYDQVANNAEHLPLRSPLGKFASETALKKYTFRFKSIS